MISIDQMPEGFLYGLHAAPECQYFVALSNLENKSTSVSLLEITGNRASVIWQDTVEYMLHSAVWDCERLLFKNEVGSLSVFELKNGKVEQNSDIPVLGRFYSPIATNNGVALVKGTEYKRALVMEGEQGYQGLTPHMNHKLAHPKYWDDERILFLSDESGEVQLKRIELANRELRLVASLSSLEAIGKMVLNQKMGLIAIGVGETIHIYKIDDALTQVQHLKTIAGINPYFYKDSITFARKSGNITNLYMMGLNSNDAQLIVPGGHSGMEKDGELYFDYWSKLGVWKYKEDGKHELTYELPFEIYSLVKSDEELIVQSLKNDYFKLTENGPEKLKFTRISWLKEVRNGTSLGVERNTAETVIYFANWR